MGPETLEVDDKVTTNVVKTAEGVDPSQHGGAGETRVSGRPGGEVTVRSGFVIKG